MPFPEAGAPVIISFRGEAEREEGERRLGVEEVKERVGERRRRRERRARKSIGVAEVEGD